MKIEISLKDLITWALMIVLILFCAIMWSKWNALRLESQVYANTQNIKVIDSYLYQVQQAQKRQPIPKIGEFSLTPKGESGDVKKDGAEEK